MTDLDRVDDLIESNASLNHIALACENKLEALTLFARAMQARYQKDRFPAAAECELCHRSPASGKCEVTWRAVTHDRKQVSRAFVFTLLAGLFGHFGTAGRITVNFLTYHPCCDSCRRRLWWRVWLTRTAKVLLFLPIVFAILATLISLISLAVLVFTPSDQSQLRGDIVSLGECLVTIGLLYAAFRGLCALSVPAALRTICRSPFEPIRVRRA
jgi:hypothetical protein